MKDDNQKKFLLQLEIDTEYFHRAFANPCTSTKLNQRRAIGNKVPKYQLLYEIADGRALKGWGTGGFFQKTSE
jgi:hypothetical protein